MRPIRLFVTVIWVCLWASLAWAASGTMSVQVRTGEMRDTPSFLSKTVAQLSYGEQVEVLDEKGAWVLVKSSNGVQGWIHQSALTRKKVPLTSGAKDEKLPVSRDELALASKGFDAAMEAEFKRKNLRVDFTWVDRMEQVRISPRDLAAFLREGGLRTQEGGGAQ